MKVKSLKIYKNPDYPTKEEVFARPDILMLVPNRWKKNACAGAALTVLLAIVLSGCGQKTSVNEGFKTSAAEKSKAPKEKLAQAVPIFEHGKGRGSFGCDSVAPPSFISEEEAFQVVQEEAKSYGINFEKPGPELKNINLPSINLYYEPENPNKGSVNSTHKGSLSLDGYNKDNKLAFEFISAEDYRSWQGKSNMVSTVETYDFLEAAKLLSQGLNKNTEGSIIGLFYNPMITPESKLRLDETAVKKLAEEELRKQVKDFFEWLKAQEII